MGCLRFILPSLFRNMISGTREKKCDNLAVPRCYSHRKKKLSLDYGLKSFLTSNLISHAARNNGFNKDLHFHVFSCKLISDQVRSTCTLFRRKPKLMKESNWLYLALLDVNQNKMAFVVAHKEFLKQLLVHFPKPEPYKYAGNSHADISHELANPHFATRSHLCANDRTLNHTVS